MKTALYVLIVLLASACALPRIGLFSGTPPDDLGVKNGRLKPPSNTPNSVSSQAGLYPGHPRHGDAQIAAFPLQNSSVMQSMATLATLLQTTPGVHIIESRPDYIYAQAQTPWFKFVDDVEFWANPANQMIEVRSASRLGRSDLGTNRQRIEALRRAYLASSPASP